MIKKRLIYFLLIWLALLLQLSVVPLFFERKFLPDLVLMLVLAWTIRDGFAGFLPWAILVGIFYDLLTYEMMGVHVVILTVCAYLVSFFSRRFALHIRGLGLGLLLLLVLLSMLFARFFMLTLQILQGTNQIDRTSDLFWQTGFGLQAFVVNVAAVLFWLWLIKWVKKYFYLNG